MADISKEAKLGLAKLVFIAGRNLADTIEPGAQGFRYISLNQVRENAGPIINSAKLTHLITSDDFSQLDAAEKEAWCSFAIPLSQHPAGGKGRWTDTSKDLGNHMQTKSGIIIPRLQGTYMEQIRGELNSEIAEEVKTYDYKPKYPLTMWL